MTRKLVLGIGVLGLLAGCSANAEESASSESVAAVSETPNAAALDCNVSGSFGEEAMKAVGDGTYVRAGTAPSNGLKSFTLGPIQEIPGWGGKNAKYTRDMAAPCLDFKAIGDGSGFPKGSALPMTETGCAGQTGKATVMMDNPAIGAFIMFEDASGLPAGKDVYFVTASRMDPNGKVSALCLANATTRDQLLVTRQ
jgi:hypothetical protein